MSAGSIARVAVPAIGGAAAGFGAATALDRTSLPGAARVAVPALAGAGSLAAAAAFRGIRTPAAALGAGLIGGALAQLAVGGSGSSGAAKPAAKAPADTPPTPPARSSGGSGAAGGPAYAGPVEVVRIDSDFADVGKPRARNHQYRPQPGDLLPDGVQMQPHNVYLSISHEGKPILRFDGMVGNIGEGPMQLALRNRNNRNDTNQVVFQQRGGELTSREITMKGKFFHEKNPSHAHLHFDDFASYELYRLKDDGTVGERVRAKPKVSFLITDVAQISDKPGLRVDYMATPDADVVQGISSGWADIYGAGLPGQEFDISGLEPGKYVLRQTFDPNNRIAESNERNNARDTVIELR